ncbi:hypothetical protein ACIBH1_10830 [Nonomuraea sp. NPDC050663]|uniref:hypothetical protein n=1 Tax=Nonomuraea sp. NPDC050663 TaxID=3364370 RepID=UPI0037908B6A
MRELPKWALAAAAVAVVAGGGAWLSQPGAQPSAQPGAQLSAQSSAQQGAQAGMQAARPGSQAVARVAVIPEAQQLWPRAVHRVPRTLPEGGQVVPRLLLDSSTLLFTAESSFERADALLTYDLASGRVTKLADIPVPDGSTVFASDFAAGDGEVVWWTARKGRDGSLVEIWRVPVSGGTAEVALSMTAGDRSGHPTALAVADKEIVYSLGAGGVYRGTRLVPGTEGQYLLNWPWIGSPGPRPHGDGSFASVRNLRTGQARTAATSAAAGKIVACGFTKCLHAAGQGRSSTLVAADGSTTHLPIVAGGVPRRLLKDRFLATAAPEDGRRRPVIWDVDRGVAGALGPAKGPAEPFEGAWAMPDGRTVGFKLDKEWVIVDLEAIS